MEPVFDYLNALAALEKPDGVIAFPTDTVYGLGCLPDRPEAVAKIYQLKDRSFNKPLILMAYGAEPLEPFLGEMSLNQAHRFQELAKTHWPGALTLVVPKSKQVFDAMTRGVETIGTRIPNCPFLQDFLKMLPQGAMATTSANRSNQPECATAAEVFETFGNQLDFILMHDRLGSGQASTVAAVEADGSVSLLRQGSLVLD